MDEQLIRFVGDNWVTIGLAYSVLKGFARLTPWTEDDKIVSLLFEAVSAVKNGKAPRYSEIR